VFLELGMKSLLSYIAFDQKSIKYLLSDQHQHLFSEKYPLFYMDDNKESAIDIALNSNLLNSVALMLDYINKY